MLQAQISWSDPIRWEYVWGWCDINMNSQMCNQRCYERIGFSGAQKKFLCYSRHLTCTKDGYLKAVLYHVLVSEIVRKLELSGHDDDIHVNDSSQVAEKHVLELIF